MKERVWILAFLLGSCTKASDSIPRAEPDIGDNQALISVGQEPTQRYLMMQLGLLKFQDSCDSNLCLAWSDENLQAEFRLHVPQMSGSLLLGDPQVQLGYRLRGAIERDISVTAWGSRTGVVTLDADIGARTLRVAVDGTLEEIGSCQSGWCGTWVDADAFVQQWAPCDGGTCVQDIPCNDGGLVSPTMPPSCPNPEYTAVPMTVKARATLQ